MIFGVLKHKIKEYLQKFKERYKEVHLKSKSLTRKQQWVYKLSLFMLFTLGVYLYWAIFVFVLYFSELLIIRLSCKFEINKILMLSISTFVTVFEFLAGTILNLYCMYKISQPKVYLKIIEKIEKFSK